MAYWYFRDDDGTPIAITNVRYDKQDIDTNELKTFLIQLSKIYLGLFIGASAIAFLLSNYITSSLEKVARQMKGINPALKNEPIAWKANDEIGTLVHEYNRMLNEVRSSVEKLAETERETAWREMAKQVAHEIKNPLTPMKLRVQHLQRTWSADDKDFKEKLNAFADAMTEQIDTLSNIATEFSNFAKMPKASQEVVAVDDALAGCVELFSTAEGVSVVFENKCVLKPRINADKEEVLRVFNNLIKNAIQAIPDGRDGLVKCVVSGNQHEVVIEVCDNGAGIPAEAREKIFQPNFTTKSQGTGLGLAMVKNIVNLANGSISYTTSPEGTCFTLVFPAYSSNAG
jgi:nitrogen fixation/metabolism regulation signal transduction histidine kinase